MTINIFLDQAEEQQRKRVKKENEVKGRAIFVAIVPLYYVVVD